MTEQEIENARADVDQLDIEQLRCGVMLQLLKIDELTKERDAWVERHKACVKCLGEALQDTTDVSVERDDLLLQIDIQGGSIDAVQAANQRLAGERDALMAAAKLALDALNDTVVDRKHYLFKCSSAITALSQAGVQ